MAAVGPASVGVRVSLPAVLSTGPSALGHAKEGGPAKAEAWRRRRHHKFSLGFSYFHLFSPSFTSRPWGGACSQRHFASTLWPLAIFGDDSGAFTFIVKEGGRSNPVKPSQSTFLL